MAEFPQPSETWMTQDEKDAWDAIADAASAFFRLPALHPADVSETARDVHNIQNRILARKAYRRARRTAT